MRKFNRLVLAAFRTLAVIGLWVLLTAEYVAYVGHRLCCLFAELFGDAKVDYRKHINELDDMLLREHGASDAPSPQPLVMQYIDDDEACSVTKFAHAAIRELAAGRAVVLADEETRMWVHGWLGEHGWLDDDYTAAVTGRPAAAASVVA